MIICLNCNKSFKRKGDLTRHLKYGTCIKKPCANCGKETTNPKFCSRECSAKINNKLVIKRKRITRMCKRCGTDVTYLRSNKSCSPRSLCSVCFDKAFTLKGTTTIGELKGKRHYQKSSRIRADARRRLQKHSEMKCVICNYSVHVETCHLKPINSFSNSSTLDEVNDLNNLRFLCKNHHWELDHNKLSHNNKLKFSQH